MILIVTKCAIRPYGAFFLDISNFKVLFCSLPQTYCGNKKHKRINRKVEEEYYLIERLWASNPNFQENERRPVGFEPRFRLAKKMTLTNIGVIRNLSPEV